MEIIKSYKIPLNNKTRLLTKSKQKIITDFAYTSKKLYNFFSKEYYQWKIYQKNQSKIESEIIRKQYEKYFESSENIKSWHSQNIYRNAKSKYIDTIKSYNSDYSKNIRSKKNIKSKSIKPYYEDLFEFPLDYRLLNQWEYKDDNYNENWLIHSKALMKDNKIDNLYWLSISNPFKSKKYINLDENNNIIKDKYISDFENINTFKNNKINIPLFFYKEIQELYDKWYKYSFSLHNDYVKIIFRYEISDKKLSEISKDVKSDKKYIDSLSIDFWKYISTYHIEKNDNKDENWDIIDWLDSKIELEKEIWKEIYNQYDMSKMYRKIKKIQFQIKNIQSELDNIKNEYNNENKLYNKEWKEIINYGFKKLDHFKLLLSKFKLLHNRIKGIRKSSYWNIINKIYKDNDIWSIILEDLSFETIEKYIKDKDGNIKKDKSGNRIINPKYKWRWYNKMLNVMWVWIWNKLFENKITLAGSQANLQDPRNSSRECSCCWHIDKLSRNWRFFKCTKCGYKADADFNAAKVLFLRYIRALKILKSG